MLVPHWLIIVIMIHEYIHDTIKIKDILGVNIISALVRCRVECEQLRE